LAHDRGLADALRQLAHQSSDQQQKRELGDEKRLRRTARTALGGERWNDFDRRRDGE
jgi:hypothetical protein